MGFPFLFTTILPPHLARCYLFRVQNILRLVKYLTASFSS